MPNTFAMKFLMDGSDRDQEIASIQTDVAAGNYEILTGEGNYIEDNPLTGGIDPNQAHDSVWIIRRRADGSAVITLWRWGNCMGIWEVDDYDAYVADMLNHAAQLGTSEIICLF